MRTLQSQPQTARILILLVVALATACRQPPPQPARSSPEYNELVRTFYIGLAALQVGHDVQADAKLAQFTQLAPAEIGRASCREKCRFWWSPVRYNKYFAGCDV